MPEIFEIHHFSALKDLIHRHPGWVVLDVDNTLIESLQDLGSVQWYDDSALELCQSGLSFDEASAKVYPLWVKLQKVLPVKPVEEGIPQMLKSWQQEGLQLMAVTSRGIDLAYRTVEQLSSIDIDLNKNAVFNRRLILEPPNPLNVHQGIIYRHGVLMCQPGANKGFVLKRFLEAIGTIPQQMVYVDDVESSLLDVQNALTELGIHVIGVRYGGCDEKVKAFSRDSARTQLEQLNTKLKMD
jgi:phosphoglycolate phosphatase-like HAD superfamily hydrolase